MVVSLLLRHLSFQVTKSLNLQPTRVPPHRNHRFIKLIYYSVFWAYNWITAPHQPYYFLIRLVLHLLRPKSVIFQLHCLHRFACHATDSQAIITVSHLWSKLSSLALPIIYSYKQDNSHNFIYLIHISHFQIQPTTMATYHLPLSDLKYSSDSCYTWRNP